MNLHHPDDHPPDGWVAAPIGGQFTLHSGGLYARWQDGRLRLGFRVRAQQGNPGGACHGGMLATFADVLLSAAAHVQADIPRQFLPTISLQLDYMAAAPMGSWVHGCTDVLKVTRNLLFSQALVHADDTLALRASGVFRRGPLLPDTEGDRPLELPGMPRRDGA